MKGFKVTNIDGFSVGVNLGWGLQHSYILSYKSGKIVEKRKGTVEHSIIKIGNSLYDANGKITEAKAH